MAEAHQLWISWMTEATELCLSPKSVRTLQSLRSRTCFSTFVYLCLQAGVACAVVIWLSAEQRRARTTMVTSDVIHDCNAEHGFLSQDSVGPQAVLASVDLNLKQGQSQRKPLCRNTLTSAGPVVHVGPMTYREQR